MLCQVVVVHVDEDSTCAAKGLKNLSIQVLNIYDVTYQTTYHFFNHVCFSKRICSQHVINKKHPGPKSWLAARLPHDPSTERLNGRRLNVMS